MCSIFCRTSLSMMERWIRWILTAEPIVLQGVSPAAKRTPIRRRRLLRCTREPVAPLLRIELEEFPGTSNGTWRACPTGLDGSSPRPAHTRSVSAKALRRDLEKLRKSRVPAAELDPLLTG